VCESQIHEYNEKSYLDDTVVVEEVMEQGYEAINSEFKLCVKCVLKWKEFDFRTKYIYTRSDEAEEKTNLKPIKIEAPD
jgi:hypothetical protein